MLRGRRSAVPVFLHVGLKKTGTSYLQSIMWHNQADLEDQRLSLVPDRRKAMYQVMLDLRGRYNPGASPEQTEDAVDRLPGHLKNVRGTRALLTEESLAASDTTQIARLVDQFAGHDLHLVLTARDLARQIPSAWQQSMQAAMSIGYLETVESLVAGEGKASDAFWRAQGLTACLTRWETAIPRERIHVVTVPQRGGAPETLLHRFCELLGVDPSRLRDSEPTVNASLGLTQSELMGRVNAALGKEFRRRDRYGETLKRYFAKKVLEGQGGDRALVPVEHEAWCRAESARVIDHLLDGGYDVIGDVEDLVPATDSFTDRDQSVDEETLNHAAVEAIARMLETRMTAREKRRLRDR